VAKTPLHSYDLAALLGRKFGYDIDLIHTLTCLVQCVMHCLVAMRAEAPPYRQSLTAAGIYQSLLLW